jgi:hypothetical protein
MSIESRITRLEEKQPDKVLAIVWLETGESEADTLARYCEARGIAKLPADTEPQFLSWLAPRDTEG